MAFRVRPVEEKSVMFGPRSLANLNPKTSRIRSTQQNAIAEMPERKT